MASPGATVTAEVALESDFESFSSATLRVRLEQVTYADAPSTTIDERVIEGVSHERGHEERVRASLSAAGVDEKAHYIVSAHLARGGKAEIVAGDYLTVQSFPVLTHGNPAQVTVRLRKV